MSAIEMSSIKFAQEHANQSVSTNVETLYLDIETADVTFVFGVDDEAIEHIPAHKNLLAAASNVFKAMFYGPLKEGDEVKIEGFNAAEFKVFLQFIYLNKVKLNDQNVASVMGLADKYNVSYCIDICAQFLTDAINSDTVCLVFGLAIFYNQPELQQICERRIVGETRVVLKSQSFEECDRNILDRILQLDQFSCTETEVFEAIMLWTKNRGEQNELTKEIIQAELGDLFYKIRFRSITFQQFDDLTQTYGHLFLADEKDEIIQLIRSVDFQPNKFNGNLRAKVEWKWDTANAVWCDRFIVQTTETVYVDPIEQTFSTNKPLLLGGFSSIHPEVYNDHKFFRSLQSLPLNVSVLEQHNVNGQSVQSVLINFQPSLDLRYEETTMLPCPVLISPGFKYIIKLEQTGAGYCYQARTLTKKVKLLSDTIITFHGDYIAEDGHTRIGTKSYIKRLHFNIPNISNVNFVPPEKSPRNLS